MNFYQNISPSVFKLVQIKDELRELYYLADTIGYTLMDII